MLCLGACFLPDEVQIILLLSLPSRSSLPVYWLWMYELSLMRYPIELFLWNEFVYGLGDACIATSSSSGATSASLGFTMPLQDSPCGLTGQQYLAARGFGQLTPLRSLLVTLAFIAALRVAAYAALRRRVALLRK